MRQTVKVELKHATIEGVISRIKGQNAYVEDINGTEYKFHVDELIILDNGNKRQMVRIGNKLVSRVICKDKQGDRYVTFNNERFLLRYHDNGVQHPTTSNLTRLLWTKQDYVDRRMHHYEKLDMNGKTFTFVVFNQIKSLMSKHGDFLDEWYSVDSHCLREWIEYAERTLEPYNKTKESILADGY